VAWRRGSRFYHEQYFKDVVWCSRSHVIWSDRSFQVLINSTYLNFVFQGPLLLPCKAAEEPFSCGSITLLTVPSPPSKKWGERSEIQRSDLNCTIILIVLLFSERFFFQVVWLVLVCMYRRILNKESDGIRAPRTKTGIRT